ncbi:MAG: hypothetical protein NW224_01075 [Leptolyngbyaceae cyanobacterium bins.302]|nr:hypothetical protein [Leptolyngbyaceae cyanobacterium bins.302]
MNEDNQEFSNRRDEFLLHWYDKLWESIDRKESGLWQFVVVYAAIAGAIATAAQNKIPPDIAIFFSLVASFWGVNVAINYGGWYYRNLLITINIEREFLDLQKDLGRIIPEKYHRIKPKVLSGIGKIHIIGFSFAIAGIMWLSWTTNNFLLALFLLIIGLFLTYINYIITSKSLEGFIKETSFVKFEN